jgi:hypothetical protein
MDISRKLLHRLWRSIFQPAARYPVDPRAVFILILSVFTGGIALIVKAGPASLEATLPRWGVLVWGITLVLGSIITLSGMAVQNLNGILAEQVGSVMVAAATLFYGTLAIHLIGAPAIQSMGIIIAWGLSCLVRWVQLQALIVSSYRTGLRHEHERAIGQEIGMQQAVESAIREEMDNPS